MAITEAFVGSPTVSNTEWSFTNASTVLATQTTAGIYQLMVDGVANMIAGDQFRIRVYERMNGGTRRTVYEGYMTGTQAQAFTLPALILKDGWDMTALRVTGSDRVLLFSIRMIG